jgi:predicted lipoprotein
VGSSRDFESAPGAPARSSAFSVTRVLLLLPVLLVACKIATIRPVESKEDGHGAQAFDAAAYVGSLWVEDVPTALEEAVDLQDFLPALAVDPAGAGAQWGRREGSGPFHVVVKGSGRVLDVDASSRTGLATIEIEVLGGVDQVRLQIGPVLRGTSIRDALPTVSFDQFVNQIQYADVANELNARVERELLASLEREALTGKGIHFVGATTLGEERPLTITPVRLEVVP